MSSLKFRVVTELDRESGRLFSYVELDERRVFGPVDVTHMRGHDFEETVRYEMSERFSRRLAEVLG